jgi:DNA-binding GntR family transcriptional regulator
MAHCDHNWGRRESTGVTISGTETEAASRLAIHDQVYASLRDALITGRIAPGLGVSLRSLAAELGVSPMPVRDAVRRLAAERALAINPANKRLSVPSLTADRLEQLALARSLIEPELAQRAAERADAALISRLKQLDGTVDRALAEGDVGRYMAANHAFHFTLYRHAQADVLLTLADSLWLQIGPFMRVVFGRIGTLGLAADHHLAALEAMQQRDPMAVRRAIAEDIAMGMDALRAEGVGQNVDAAED